MGTVKIPREIAEAIKAFKESGMNNYAIAKAVYGIMPVSVENNLNKYGGYYNRIVDYCDKIENGSKFLEAIINGYEIEVVKTPEESVREYYHSFSLQSNKSTVRETLNRLGVVIKGVND